MRMQFPTSVRDLFVDDPVAEFANSFGHIALWTFSFFLIPVARHSPLLKVFGWDLSRSVHNFHIWPGRIIVISSAVHGAVHMYRWKRAINESLLRMILPNFACWRSGQYASEQAGSCLDDITGCSCDSVFRNFVGLLALAGMAIIFLTSLPIVRRQQYLFYYLVHVIAAPILVILLCLHFTRSLVYMAPSLLYYTASSFPAIVETVCSRQQRGTGVRVLGCKRIHFTGELQPCVDLTIEASDDAMQQYKPGQHVFVFAPGFSIVSHPFTVNRVIGQHHQLRMVFRERGSFTRALSASLCGSNAGVPSVPMHVDGYHGSTSRVNDAQKHDTVVMIAGGIGIVAYLSLVDELVSATSRGTNGSLQEITLLWLCREASLIQFIRCEYLERMYRKAFENGISFRTNIFYTGHSSPDLTSSFSNRLPTHFCTGEPFVPSRASNALAANGPMERYSCGTFALYSINWLVGPVITWYACFNALYEEDVAATVWSWLCVFAIAASTGLLAKRMDAAAFGAYSFVVWFGLFSIWFLYKNVQNESENLLARLWSPSCVLVLALSASIASHFLADRSTSCIGTEYSQVASEQSPEGTEMSIIEDKAPPTGVSIDAASTPHYSRDCFETTIVGRSEFQQHLINLIEREKNPGVFSCGPPSLLHTVRKAVKKCDKTKFVFCRSIHIYEESFET